MRSVADVLSRMGSMDPDAVFEALCRIESAGSEAADPEASFTLFLRELGGERPVKEVDDFPPLSELARAAEPPPAAQAPLVRPSDPDAVRTALAGALREYQSVLSKYNRDFDQVFARREQGVAETDDETIRRLKSVQQVLVKYPVAAQAAFAALVREGRQYASTAEGREWKERLAGSEVLARARTLFEGLANGMVAEGQGELPSTYLDGFVRALDRSLEDVLGDVGGAGSKE